MRNLIWVCILFTMAVQAQSDSTWLIRLPAAEVQDDRLRRFAQGHHVLTVDSADITLQAFPSIDKLLTNSAGLFLRDYGPAGLSLPSLRGTGPQHTAVLWHGIPLNSAMNGVIDLSLLPSWLFDDISIQMGGSSALWGSGAIGGAIHLGQNMRWQQPASLRLMMQQGSFGNRLLSASWQQSGTRWHTHTHFHHRRAINNYPLFRQDGSMWYRQPHAQTEQVDFSQSNAFRLSKKDLFIVRLWWQQASRELPPATGGTWSGGHQSDRNLRSMVSWQHQESSYHWEWRVAVLQEQFQYDDSLPTPTSLSSATTLLSEGTITGTWGNSWNWQAGITGQQASATADGYNGNVALSQGAAYLHLTYQKAKWEAGGQVRQGAAEGYRVPVVGSVWAQRAIGLNWQIKGQVSKDYRLPTLNDRFWIPGGNTMLQPEQSLGQEVEIQWAQTHTNGAFSWEMAIFHRHVTDWILWTPQLGNWQAQNVWQVRTYGVETSLSAQKKWDKLTVATAGHYQWTNATDLDRGLQLIYTPHHQAMAMVKAQKGPITLQYIHRLTGKRYISSDHSYMLPSFTVAQAGIHYLLPLGKHQVSLQGTIDNLWHTQYDIIPGRRMPGRSVNLTIQCLLYPTKSTQL